MKKVILLLLVGVAMLSCKENPSREAAIREYYEYQIMEDSLSQELTILRALSSHLEDSLCSVGKDYVDDDRWREIFDETEQIIQNIDHCKEIQKSCKKIQRLKRKFWDRNYWRIYKKELREQGRIK